MKISASPAGGEPRFGSEPRCPRPGVEGDRHFVPELPWGGSTPTSWPAISGVSASLRLTSTSSFTDAGRDQVGERHAAVLPAMRGGDEGAEGEVVAVLGAREQHVAPLVAHQQP